MPEQKPDYKFSDYIKNKVNEEKTPVPAGYAAPGGPTAETAKTAENRKTPCAGFSGVCCWCCWAFFSSPGGTLDNRRELVVGAGGSGWDQYSS
jgi:hypothetical protein